jgi:hypothetical protein
MLEGHPRRRDCGWRTEGFVLVMRISRRRRVLALITLAIIGRIGRIALFRETNLLGLGNERVVAESEVFDSQRGSADGNLKIDSERDASLVG